MESSRGGNSLSATKRASVPSVDPTLHLPRILCLHGGGTNARIFQTQCRAVSRALAPHFRLAYAEAPFPSSAGPDVASVYADCGPFKRWGRWLPEHDQPSEDGEAIRAIDASLAAAIAADDALGADGPWVALLGFSQGAKVAASLLFRQQVLADLGKESGDSRRSDRDIRWRFAVVLAGRSPLVSLFADPATFASPLLDGASATGAAWRSPPDLMEVARGRHVLRLPTIHVHGLLDPGLELHRDLLDSYCDPDAARLIEWDGNHRVPLKTTDVAPVVDQILDVARKTGALE
ncbi:hypothetical protein SLS62_003647 [Diatrype stigma]|uniref:Serine hydrolase domain-containing protein n=1 Tax=Diatrype stigma TaxID=117547 RepID=A0AAN9YU37_9PEZI